MTPCGDLILLPLWFEYKIAAYHKSSSSLRQLHAAREYILMNLRTVNRSSISGAMCTGVGRLGLAPRPRW